MLEKTTSENSAVVPKRRRSMAAENVVNTSEETGSMIPKQRLFPQSVRDNETVCDCL